MPTTNAAWDQPIQNGAHLFWDSAKHGTYRRPDRQGEKNRRHDRKVARRRAKRARLSK